MIREIEGSLPAQSWGIKGFVLAFVLSMCFGYFSGFKFLVNTTELKVSGIEENYLGNEDIEEAETMKFKKSEAEIITIIHTHVVSFSLIYLALGFLLILAYPNRKWRNMIIIEPFIYILLSFGGIWLLWYDILWMKYVVMVSGILLTLSFVVEVGMILVALVKTTGKGNS